jgi:RNA polymerase sigma factor (sigma-70 family)
MVLCEKWDNLSKDNIQAWLYRTADNKLQEHFRHHRKKSKEIAYIEDLDDFRKNSLTYEQEFEAVSDDDIEIYREEILRELSEKERELFDLVYIDKKPYKKIIEELSITQETFNKRLYRLRKKIKTAVTMKIHE